MSSSQEAVEGSQRQPKTHSASSPAAAKGKLKVKTENGKSSKQQAPPSKQGLGKQGSKTASFLKERKTFELPGQKKDAPEVKSPPDDIR